MEAPIEDLARLFEEVGVPFALIGGHAVNHWLTPRLTGDIDLTMELGTEKMVELRRLLKEHAEQWGVGDRLRRLRGVR